MELATRSAAATPQPAGEGTLGFHPYFAECQVCSWHLVNNTNYIFQITGWADVLIRPQGAFVNGGKNVGFPGSSVVKNLLLMQETQVRSLVQENALEEKMATHSSVLAWRILWILNPESSLAAYSLWPRNETM